MATFIIYCRNKDHLAQTLDDLIDKTPPGILEQIILCDESNTISEDDYTLNEWDIILQSQGGRSRAWNAAAAVATSEQLVFLTSPAKFGTDWFPPITKESDDWTVVSPVVYQLDTNLWATENNGWRRYGLRWDMSTNNRRFGNRSPLAAFCMVINKQFFDDIDGFDDGAGPGSGENVCLSLKAWMAGGDVVVVDDSYVAMVPEVESGSDRNLARLAESFFPKHTSLFYDACGVVPGSIDVGRIDGLTRFVGEAERSSEWWLENLQPELLGVYLLRNTAHGKRIAVVGDGPSLDYMNLSLINNHDIIISVDYIGLLIDSNYVMTNSADVVVELRDKYVDQQFVVPYVMENRVAGEYTLASDIVPNAVQFEVGEIGNVASVNPPFCDFGSCLHMALHFALFLGPCSISLFGCDNKFIEDKSHTSELDYYNGGKIWTDSDQTKKRLSFYDNGIDQLGRLALSLNIPLIRVGHA